MADIVDHAKGGRLERQAESRNVLLGALVEHRRSVVEARSDAHGRAVRGAIWTPQVSPNTLTSLKALFALSVDEAKEARIDVASLNEARDLDARLPDLDKQISDMHRRVAPLNALVIRLKRYAGTAPAEFIR